MPEIIFASHPSAYSALVLGSLLQSDEIIVRACVHSSIIKRRGSNWLADVFDLIKVSGLRYAIYLWWVSNIFEMIARLSRKQHDSQLCKQHNIPVIKTDDIWNPYVINQIQKVCKGKGRDAPIYFITCFFNQKLPAELLALDGIEFINLHPGALPEYRGVDPVFEVMLTPGSELTTTLHVTAEKLDEGDMLGDISSQIDADNSLLANNLIVFEQGAELLCQWLRRNGLKSLEDIESKPQEGKAAYHGWPRAAKVRKIKKLFSIFTWRELFPGGR